MASAPEDLRDLGGRLSRLVVSIVVGVVAALAIASILPISPRRFHGCLGRHGSQIIREDAPLILAGIVAITLATYSVLQRLRR